MFVSNASRYANVDVADVIEQARRCLECGEPWPCVSACPQGVNIQAAMRMVAAGALVARPRPAGALAADTAAGDAFAQEGIDRSFG